VRLTRYTSAWWTVAALAGVTSASLLANRQPVRAGPMDGPLAAPVRAQDPVAGSPSGPSGVREASWSPDGRRLVATWYDAIWTMTLDGRDPKRVVTKSGGWVSERDPAWSPDGQSIAFSADTHGQFDVWIAPAAGGTATRVTALAGDERWPSWTHDGRLVFSHRDPKGAWQLFVTSADGTGTPTRLTPDDAAEWQGQVSPDGKRIAFISDREADNGDGHVWVRELSVGDASDGAARPRMARVTTAAGGEGFPAWAPDNARVAYLAARGNQRAVWVSPVPSMDPSAGTVTPTGRGGAGRVGGGGGRGGAGVVGGSADAPVLASRHGGVPAWSPNGQILVIATGPTANAGYNGNPNRNDDDPPTALADASAFALWRVDAPRAVDEGAKSLALPPPDTARWTSAFDQVWQTLKSLYYTTGPSAAAWDVLRDKYRAQAATAKDAASAETVIDALVAEQPLIKPPVQSSRAVVTSGSALASQAGVEMLEKGGNVVDAGIAVAIALGVVEPDATSLGGDGQAILFLKGMAEPVVVEYKDMTPSHATPDNPRLFLPSGARTASDGPSVTNIPGVAAGLDLLYQKYGSKHVSWADIVAPAITLAEDGFVLDEALPTTVAEGRASFTKYPEAAKVFLPGGRPPKPGDRFVNKDYAETLRLLAKEGGQSFYRGTIAQRIVADMAANGGVITAEDLAQYRAMERRPLVGHYRGHLVYSVPAPVSDGARLIETLNILDNYQPRPSASYTTDADYLHYLIEAWRVRDNGPRIADPERWPVEMGDHLEPSHARDRFALIDPKRAYVAQASGRGGGPPVPQSSEGMWAEDDTARIQTGTTAFVVADADGNMIAFTQTLSTWGGNFYVSKGLGFLYNDHFRGGGRGGGFGSLLPLMRSSTTSVPTLVFAPSPAARGALPGFTPQIAVGCAGNAWIPASVYNIITNVIDSGMSAQQAIEAPRLLIGTGNGGRSSVQIEDRIPRAILADLEARGHSFTKVGRKGEVKYGYASVAVVHAATGTVEAGAEPRRSHGAAAAGASTPIK
jgi:gamma-glutamyltranspeptidase/glutathione hydrolase